MIGEKLRERLIFLLIDYSNSRDSEFGNSAIRLRPTHTELPIKSLNSGHSTILKSSPPFNSHRLHESTKDFHALDVSSEEPSKCLEDAVLNIQLKQTLWTNVGFGSITSIHPTAINYAEFRNDASGI